MKSKYPVVLASASPRRIELLKRLFEEFEVLPADIEEHERIHSPIDLSVALAWEKAAAIAAERPNSLVIAADTVVAVNDEFLSKPKNEEDARRMLSKLSAKTHRVVTGVCLLPPAGAQAVLADETRVTFREISEKEIEDYIATGEPMDKAGAYAIQGGAAKFVVKVEGDYDNVVGLPVEALRASLVSHGWAEE